MKNNRIRKYDELEVEEKEVIDCFRQMKLLCDHNRFRLHKVSN